MKEEGKHHSLQTHISTCRCKRVLFASLFSST